MALESFAEKYFSSLNPLASRISEDLKETKDSYEHLWETLTEQEKREIFNEAIIKPEILVKYKQKNSPQEETYAAKIVVDDNCSYRDEHSGPFSVRTQSQRDIYSLFQKKYCQEVAKPKKPDNKQNQTQNFNKSAKSLNIDDRKYSITLDEENIILEVTSSMPKTGLDFLDDW